MTTITPQQKRELKEQAHELRPVIIIGKGGLTPGVLQEINTTLEYHELIKIRINDANDREELEAMSEKICKETRAHLIQAIGKIIAIYRKNLNK